MGPNCDWIRDWKIGVSAHREKDIASELLSVFIDFWNTQKLDQKSNKTKRRYSGALHSLGGYLVEQSISDEDKAKTTAQLLSQYVGPDDAPLICLDNETWQGEIDLVCRKLYRYLMGNF